MQARWRTTRVWSQLGGLKTVSRNRRLERKVRHSPPAFLRAGVYWEPMMLMRRAVGDRASRGTVDSSLPKATFGQQHRLCRNSSPMSESSVIHSELPRQGWRFGNVDANVLYHSLLGLARSASVSGLWHPEFHRNFRSPRRGLRNQHHILRLVCHSVTSNPQATWRIALLSRQSRTGLACGYRYRAISRGVGLAKDELNSAFDSALMLRGLA